MKNLIYIATFLVSLSFVGNASAMKRMYGMAGCGLGSVVMGAEGGQISAATTNGTFYNQLFGITSGTLNCIDSASGKTASNIDNFIRGNEAALATDISRGQGETLAALGDVMGCSNTRTLGKVLKKNYSTIFTKTEAKTMRMTDSVINVVKSNKTLNRQCTKVSAII